MSRDLPMEYRWEETNPADDDTLNDLAAEGWEVVKGVVVERNRTVYVMMERVYEELVAEDDTVIATWEDGSPKSTIRTDPETGQQFVELHLPPLAPGWEKIVDDTVAQQAADLDAIGAPPPNHLNMAQDVWDGFDE